MREIIEPLTLNHYLFTGVLLFVLGVIGFLSRRNIIIMFLCTELMFQGIVVTLIVFSRYHLNFDGQVFVIFVLTIAAAESAMALGLIILLYRHRQTLDAFAWSQIRRS